VAQYFKRDIRLQIGTLEIAALAADDDTRRPLLSISFKAEASLSSTPNKAEIEIVNLSEDSRTRIQAKGLPVVIEAGYQGFTRVVFTGDTRFAKTTRQGTDWITTVETGDGASARRIARINESLPAAADVATILRTASRALGLDPGNLEAKIAEGGTRTLLKQWANGGVLTGNAHDVFARIAADAGYQFSIQRGSIQLLAPNEATQAEAVLLTPRTGLLGSPDVGEKGKVNARSLLNGDITAGRKVRLESSQIEGFFRVEKARFSGATWGPDWSTEMELKPL
jgi:hypothetical protein